MHRRVETALVSRNPTGMMLSMPKTVLATLFLAAAPHLAFAQTSAPETAGKRTLTLAGARLIVGAAEAEARRLNTTGAIAVVDDGATCCT